MNTCFWEISASSDPLKKAKFGILWNPKLRKKWRPCIVRFGRCEVFFYSHSDLGKTLKFRPNQSPCNSISNPNTSPSYNSSLEKKREGESKKFPVNFSSRWGRGKKTPHQLPCNSHLIFLLFPIKPYHLPIFPYHFPIPNLTVGSKKWEHKRSCKGSRWIS